MIPATRWVEAPAELRALGADLGHELVAYIRRIGRFLLWRAGPAAAPTRATSPSPPTTSTEQYTYRLFPDGTARAGPDGQRTPGSARGRNPSRR